ncbi:phage tail tape measure protein [Vibrio algicola]|uniref:Phage tail tape measure protein n=1 Tax=Vibrio algicola TaxID=2662262 RepID=A0A5Q0TIZ7_9VIBR|nr:phage tail tape measure protein [Vibrio algicola]
MAKRLETDIVLNLAGNLANKAKQYGNSMSQFAQKNQRAMTLVKTTTAAAGRGIDRLGNRYVGMATAFATGATVRNVAAFDSQMTRIGTNAKLSADEVDGLKQSVQDISNNKDIRVDAGQLASGVDVLLGKTGDLKFVTDNLENMGLFMQAFGADAQSTGALFAQFREKGITESEAVMDTIDKLYGQFAIGSVSVKDLAGISEQLFATYQGKGPEAIQQMGALVQLFAKAKGNANESLTSIQAVFATFSDKKKVEFLDQQGIEVFKKGTKELREPAELLLEILDKAKNDPLKLGDVFDQTSLQGLASLYSSDNKALLKEMVSDTTDVGATQKAAATNAATFDSALTSLNNSFEKFANMRLAEPIQDLADAINSVDDDTIQNWLDWGEAAAWALGGLVVAKKGLDIAASVKGVFGKGGIPGSGGVGGKGGFADLGATPVYVVNMPAGGMNNSGTLGGGSNKGTKGSKVKSAAGKALAATILYPIVESTMDALIGDTAFGKWAQNTTLGSLFSSDDKESKSVTQAVKNYQTNDGTTPATLPWMMAPQPLGIGGNIKVDIGVSDDRITKKVTGSFPGLTVNPDSGIN